MATLYDYLAGRNPTPPRLESQAPRFRGDYGTTPDAVSDWWRTVNARAPLPIGVTEVPEGFSIIQTESGPLIESYVGSEPLERLLRSLTSNSSPLSQVTNSNIESVPINEAVAAIAPQFQPSQFTPAQPSETTPVLGEALSIGAPSDNVLPSQTNDIESLLADIDALPEDEGLPALPGMSPELSQALSSIGQRQTALPELPTYTPQITAPDVSNLAGQAGSYLNQLLGQYPGFAGIQQDLSGQIAPDVRQQIEQAAAERGITLGVPGAQNVDASLLRALGLTSDALRQRGQENLRAAIGALPQLDIRDLFISPTEQARQGLQRYGMELQVSADERRQLRDIDAAFQRQALGIASERDLQLLRQTGSERLQTMESDSALERTILGIASQQDLELLREQHQADIALLEQTGLDRRQAAALAQQAQLAQLEQQGLDRRQAEALANQISQTQAELGSREDLARLQAGAQAGNISAQLGAQAQESAQRLAAQQQQLRSAQQAEQARYTTQRQAEQNAQRAALDYFNQTFRSPTSDPYAATQSLWNQWATPVPQTAEQFADELYYLGFPEADIAQAQSGLPPADYWSEWNRLQAELAGNRAAGLIPETEEDIWASLGVY